MANARRTIRWLVSEPVQDRLMWLAPASVAVVLVSSSATAVLVLAMPALALNALLVIPSAIRLPGAIWQMAPTSP